jgi:probable HAF family extracellular repeat protein
MVGSPRKFPHVHIRTVLALAVVALCGVDVPTQSPPYGVIALGLPGGTVSAGRDIDNLGLMVVGGARASSGATRAFAVGYYGPRELGTLGGPDSEALAVSGGTVVGWARNAAGQQRAFLYESGAPTPSMISLGTLGGTWSTAYDVRNNMVVGAAAIAGDARVRAFHYVNGTMSAVPIDRGGNSSARGVNSSAEIVGQACTAGNAACRAFLIQGAGPTGLGSSGPDSIANGINEGSEVVGTVSLSGTARHAFRYSSGTMLDLGTLGGQSSEGLAINDAGAIVGTAQNAAGGWRAFVWRDGIMTDLNTLLPAGSGWVLQTAAAISEGGQVTGTGTLNGVARAFLLTPPTDLWVFPNGVRTQATSNLPNGVEAGKSIRWITSFQILDPRPIAVYNARSTHTITGPAVFTAPTSPPVDGITCQIESPTVATCDIFYVDSVNIGREVWLTARTTGPGPITHRVQVTSHVPDVNSANDSILENNRAVALSTLTLTPATIAGGKATSVRLTLTDHPPGGDAVVQVSSSRPDIAPVPSPFIMPVHGTSTRAFNIIPAVVSVPTPVEITATYGLVTRSQTLTVVPPVLSQFYLTPTTVIGGCGTSAGKIVLSGSAPAGGTIVPLTNTNGKANVPSSVTVAGGTSVKTFTVTTNAVTAPTDGNVTAAYGGVSQKLRLTVRPIRASTVTLTPNPVTGGGTVSGTVTLDCPAAPGNVTVTLSSGNSAVAAPTVSSIVIPAGVQTGSFSVRTVPVTANTTVNIYATVFGTRKGASLTVRP